VLFVVLIVVKRSKLADTRVARPRPLAESYYGPWPVRLVAGAAAVAVLALIPSILPSDIAIWGSGLIYVIVLLSLGLLVKESGQVSLCQSAFAAVGGGGVAHSATQWGLPWIVAVLFAGVVAAAVGLLVAIPAIRVSGVFLALATLGFGLALQNLVYPTGIMFGKSYDGLPNLPRPGFAHTQRGFYYLILVATVLTAVVMLSIRAGRLGRLLRGLANSPLALNTLGTSVTALRVIVFCISAFFAGLAGGLYASFFQEIGLGTPLFQPEVALELFAVVLLVAGGTPWYALQAGLALEILPTYFARWFPSLSIGAYVSLLFGAGSVAAGTLADRAPALPKPIQAVLERFRSPSRVRSDLPELVSAPPTGDGLQVRRLTVRFGGVQAVRSLEFDAPFGRITGLIGPNGAGKTTSFNACSGLVRPAGGEIFYRGREITALPPAVRARLGIGRTFQHAELWDALTVRENCALGHEASLAGRGYLTQLAAKPADRARTEAAATEAMALAGISDLADRRAGDLSTGQRRLVELARVLAGPFDLLLLDEPSSGLDKGETDRFGSVLRRVVKQRGSGILLVEHDMHLVMGICEYIYVMDFGQKIFEGTPADVGSSQVVRAAYLGSEEILVGPTPQNGSAGLTEPSAHPLVEESRPSN
jgi:ABC-type branched-subunit amino acid transport system ATPase component/ABC-type branched-subunit amino acid transport system permease subunit